MPAAVGFLFLQAFPGFAALEPRQEPNQEQTQEQTPEQAPEPSPDQAQPPNAPQDQAPLPASNTARLDIHGTVRNSLTGDPLPRALVQIEGDADTGTLTDGEGRFEIPGLPPGPQTIRVRKPGFRDRPYATEESGLEAEGPAHSVLVAPQMPDLNFALAPSASIRGRVELSTGDQADGINIALFHQVVQLGRTSWIQIAAAQTNGEGAFRFGNLPDGLYVLSTMPALESEPAVFAFVPASAATIARSGYAATYYPDARDFAGAAQIRLAAGAQAEANFNLALEPFYPVSASALSPNGKAASAEMPAGNTAVVLDASGHPIQYVPQYDPTTHTLQVSLPDGNYALLIHTVVQIQFSGRVSQQSGADLAGSVSFTVAGHAVNHLRVPLAPPAKNTVHIRLIHGAGSGSSSAAAQRPADLVTLSVDSADRAADAQSEGVWSMNGHEDTIEFTTQPGNYWISPVLAGRGICAGSFTAGSVNLAREPLTVSLAAAPPPMELTLRDDCATLALALPPSLATFLPGEEPFYTVYIVPDFDTSVDPPPMTIHPSSGPVLTIDSLTPGSYHVYTFATPVHLAFHDAAAMAALANPGQPVTLTPGTTTHLTLEAPAQ